MRAGTKPIGWERVYIFISSTFNDMHAERDFLVKKVFPQLAEWCERRKLRMVDVDLRWGVTEEEATRNKNVVEVCLNRIDECRPFFLCFLGQRYGWVPRREDVADETLGRFPGLGEAIDGQHSVTELEILHAVVSPFHSRDRVEEKGYNPADHAFFYLRDDSYLEDLPSEPGYLRRIYTDEAETVAEKREFLLAKQKKTREGTVPGSKRPVVTYSGVWSERERSPELAIPLRCPALLDENVARWQRLWEEAAGVRVSGRDVAQDSAKAEAAREFNERLTKGRLTEFTANGEPLEAVILRDLKAAISESFPDRVVVPEKGDLQNELDQQEQFLFINSEGFIEREGDFATLDTYVEGDSDKPFVLTAPAGMGKSTLLANWIDRYRARVAGQPGESVHYRFIGQSDLSTTVPNLLHSLLSELQGVAGKIPESMTEMRRAPNGEQREVEVPLRIPDDPVKLRETWRDLLQGVGQRGKTVLVLDALNQLESGLSDLRWLPRPLPDNIKLIVSFKRGEQQAEELLERFRQAGEVQLSEVRPFRDEDDRRRLVKAYLAQYLKELDESHLRELIGSPGAQNPLFLKVVLSELRVFGAFASLGEKVQRDFGETPVCAFDAVLARLEQDPAYSPIPPAQGVPLLFGLLSHARRGLTVDELTGLFMQSLGVQDTPSVRLAAGDGVHLFLRQVRAFLARRDGRYDVFYESFGIAAKQRYVKRERKEPAPKKLASDWHRALAEYFGRQPLRSDAEVGRMINLRKLVELPYQLAHGKLWGQFEQTLSDFEFLQAKVEAMGPQPLIQDYEEGLRAGHQCQDLGLVQDAVRLSAHVLTDDSAQLAGHLVGRLLCYDSPLVEALVEQARGWNAAPWLRPLTRSLASPDEPLRFTLEGHARDLVSVALGSNARFIISHARDNTVRLWDIELGDEIASLDRQCRLAVTADGRKAVSGSFDRIVTLWDLQKGAKEFALVGHEDDIRAVAISADGRRAVSSSTDRTVQVWDLERGVRLSRIAHYQDVVGHLVISPDGRWAVCTCSPNPPEVWELERGPSIRGGLPGAVVGFIENSRVVVETSESLELWDLEQVARLRQLLAFDEKPPSAITVSPDGRSCITVSHDKRGVNVWNLATGEKVHKLSGHTDWVVSTAVADDWRKAVTGSHDGTARLWDLERGQELCTLVGHSDKVVSVAMSPDGRYVVTGSDDCTIKVWDLAHAVTGATVSSHHGAITGIAVDRGWHTALTGSGDSTVKVGELGLFEEVHTLPGLGNTFTNVALTRDGQKAIVALTDHTLRVWDVVRGEELFTLFGHTDKVICVAITEDGRRAVSGSADHTLRIWDMEQGAELSALEGHAGQIWFVAVTPDGRYAVSGAGFGEQRDNIRVWDLKRRKQLCVLSGHTDWIRGLAVSSDGNRAFSASQDGTVRVWDLRRACKTRKSLSRGKLDVYKLVHSPRKMRATGHNIVVSVQSLAVTPDGRRAVTRSYDGTMKVWDLNRGVEVQAMVSDKGIGGALALTPDGRRLVSLDSSVRLWDLDSGACIAEFVGDGDFCTCDVAPDGTNIIAAEKTGRVHFLRLEWPTSDGGHSRCHWR